MHVERRGSDEWRSGATPCWEEMLPLSSDRRCRVVSVNFCSDLRDEAVSKTLKVVQYSAKLDGISMIWDHPIEGYHQTTGSVADLIRERHAGESGDARVGVLLLDSSNRLAIETSSSEQSTPMRPVFQALKEVCKGRTMLVVCKDDSSVGNLFQLRSGCIADKLPTLTYGFVVSVWEEVTAAQAYQFQSLLASRNINEGPTFSRWKIESTSKTLIATRERRPRREEKKGGEREIDAVLIYRRTENDPDISQQVKHFEKICLPSVLPPSRINVKDFCQTSEYIHHKHPTNRTKFCVAIVFASAEQYEKGCPQLKSLVDSCSGKSLSWRVKNARHIKLWCLKQAPVNNEHNSALTSSNVARLDLCWLCPAYKLLHSIRLYFSCCPEFESRVLCLLFSIYGKVPTANKLNVDKVFCWWEKAPEEVADGMVDILLDGMARNGQARVAGSQHSSDVLMPRERKVERSTHSSYGTGDGDISRHQQEGDFIKVRRSRFLLACLIFLVQLLAIIALLLGFPLSNFDSGCPPPATNATCSGLNHTPTIPPI